MDEKGVFWDQHLTLRPSPQTPQVWGKEVEDLRRGR